MRHICCERVLSKEEWEQWFGEISREYPYGRTFWDGFQRFMDIVYMPRILGRGKSWLAGIKPRMGHFTLPLSFSKRNAAAPCDLVANPASANKYPAMFFFESTNCWMVCINIAVNQSKPWRVDPGWCVLQDMSAPSSSSFSSSFSPAPLVFTTSTVVIEELDDAVEELDDENEWVNV